MAGEITEEEVVERATVIGASVKSKDLSKKNSIEPPTTKFTKKNSKKRLDAPKDQRTFKAIQILKCIGMFLVKHFRADHGWLLEVRGNLIIVAALTATIAYQSILNPPGGLKQDRKDGHLPGTAVLDRPRDVRFATFLNTNILMFIVSSWIIALALSGLPNSNKIFLWLLIYAIYITVACMILAFRIGAACVFPETSQINLFDIRMDDVLLYGSSGIVGFIVLLHMVRSGIWLINKISKNDVVFQNVWCSVHEAPSRFLVLKGTLKKCEVAKVQDIGRPLVGNNGCARIDGNAVPCFEFRRNSFDGRPIKRLVFVTDGAWLAGSLRGAFAWVGKVEARKTDGGGVGRGQSYGVGFFLGCLGGYYSDELH
ncbi:hypothetical protein Vadar_026219 [Vaccinium darrowii]|uniref:Uncharacterized protein n=1 Tax=Vaccinium darrowii TaxID=229202 RepID=A0ACB7XTB0_9ERIC|nr:hypothetical protein Vadar_026219 [Vaccinium darrowii]